MRSRGFTLVELLVVMTISAILIAAAVPSFQWLITTTRASNGANALSGAFELARSESIRRGVVVSVCRTLNPNAPEASLACSNAAGGGYAAGDWASGWVMFEKRGAPPNNAFDNAADVVLFRQQEFGPGNRRVIIQSNVATPAVGYDRFGTAATAPTPTFSIDYRDPGVSTLSAAARCIGVLPVVGRINSFRPTAGVCS
jgi:prepilin-type N-terminal cleavage/methylation domain-containing protein